MILFPKVHFFRIVILLLVVLIIDVSAIHAQIVKNYSAKSVPILEKEFDVVKMVTIDDYLIISKQKRTLEAGDYLFCLLRLPEMKLICEFGRVGRGPNEFEAQTRFNNMIKVFNDSIQFWFYELNITKLQQVTLHLPIQNKPYLTINKTISVPFELNLSNPVYLGDNKIAGKVLSFDMNLSRLRFYNLLSKKTINCPLLTPVKNKKPSDVIYVQSKYNPAFASFVAYSDENSVFVSAMISIDRIDLYNNEGEHINSIVNSKNMLRTKKLEDILSRKYDNGGGGGSFIGTYYYRSPIVYKSFFAVLYLGAEYDDARKKESLPCQLRFYDYSGKLKAILKLNENISTYTIDEKRGVLYSSSRFSGKNFKYDIKQLLDEL